MVEINRNRDKSVTLRSLVGHDGHGAVADAARVIGVSRETMSRVLSGSEDRPRARQRLEIELTRRERAAVTGGRRSAMSDSLTRASLSDDLDAVMRVLRDVDLPDDRTTGKVIGLAHLAQVMLSGGDVEREIIKLIARHAECARKMIDDDGGAGA